MLTSPITRPSRLRRLMALTAVAGLLVTACGNSDDDDADDGAAAEDTADETGADTAAADTGDDAATAEETAEPTADDTADEMAEDTATADEMAEDTATADEMAEDTATADEGDDATATTEPAADEPAIGEFQPIEGVPGVTDEQIGVAILGTGPSNPLGYCLMDCWQGGVQAYFDYYNSLGGVHGRELVINRVEDDEVGNNQVKAIELMGADDVFATFAAPLLFNGFSEFVGTDMPVYTTAPAAQAADGAENIYLPYGTFCGTCPRKLTVQSAVVAGATKVASLGLGESQSSKDCANNNQATFERWGPDVGIEFVYLNDTLPFGFPNGVGPEVTAMKDLGVDFIVTCIDVSSALVLEQELQRQGMTDTYVSLPQGYGDDEFLAENAELLEGDVLTVAFKPFELAEEGDAVSRFLEWMDKGGHEVTDNAMYGWQGATLFVQGLLEAGPQFDRASLIEATNSITDYTADGLVQPTDWSRQHTAPTADDPVTNAPEQDCSVFMRVENGAAVIATDPENPFTCFDPAIEEWHEPTQVSFD